MTLTVVVCILHSGNRLGRPSTWKRPPHVCSHSCREIHHGGAGKIGREDRSGHLRTSCAERFRAKSEALNMYSAECAQLLRVGVCAHVYTHSYNGVCMYVCTYVCMYVFPMSTIPQNHDLYRPMLNYSGGYTSYHSSLPT